MTSITMHSDNNRVFKLPKLLPDGVAEKTLALIARVLGAARSGHRPGSQKPVSYISQHMIDPVIGPEIQRVLR